MTDDEGKPYSVDAIANAAADGREVVAHYLDGVPKDEWPEARVGLFMAIVNGCDDEETEREFLSATLMMIHGHAAAKDAIQRGGSARRN